jgi:hypothetical protein
LIGVAEPLPVKVTFLTDKFPLMSKVLSGVVVLMPTWAKPKSTLKQTSPKISTVFNRFIFKVVLTI